MSWLNHHGRGDISLFRTNNNSYYKRFENMGRRRKLFCMNGHYLEISGGGNIRGTRNYHSPHVALDLIPVGRNLITIKGAHTGYFLAVGSQGEVYTTDIENDECIFKEVLTKTFYDNYLSYKYSGKDLLLGLMRTGVAVAVPEVAAQQHHEYETRFVTKLSQ